eukprot:234534-Hanusia_phi.AAC.1
MTWLLAQWDDGRRVKYYRSEAGGTRYPLLPAGPVLGLDCRGDRGRREREGGCNDQEQRGGK